MDFDGPFDGPGFGPWGNWWHLLTLIFGGFVWLLGVALLLAVLFFLIRFLLVATKAAQLYVNRHSPAEPERPTDNSAATPAASTSPAASSPTATTAAATTPAATTPAATTSTATTAKLPRTSTAAAKPASKPRTPRTPPPADTSGL